MSKALEARVAQLEATMESVQLVTQELARRIEAQVTKLEGFIGADDPDGPFHGEFKELRGTVEALRDKVEARNKSAAVKRNMTDADAMRVLQGDLSEEGHKEAAEALGLTYAQVYSCRMGFTFKHVHRQLEKSGWRCKWAKG